MKYYTILFSILFFAGCTVEEHYYVTYSDEQEENRVTVSVAYSRVGGGMVQEARGKVKNHGPLPIQFVRVYLGSNYADSKIVPCNPPTLLVGEIGDWELFNMEGTSITQKEAMFDVYNP